MTSYVLEYQNDENPYAYKQETIRDFINAYATVYVSSKERDQLSSIAQEFIEKGLKEKDA